MSFDTWLQEYTESIEDKKRQKKARRQNCSMIDAERRPKRAKKKRSPSQRQKKKLRAHTDRKSSAYKDWRLKVLKRDGFKCLRCKSTENLHVHHCMVGYAHNIHRRLDINNGATLCMYCHACEHPFMLKDLKEKFGEELVDSEMRWRRERRDAAIRANQIQKQA